MLTIIRRFVALLTLVGATSAFAQSYTYSIYVDADNNAATGCNLSLPGGTVTGAESVLTATIGAGSPPQVTQVARSACSGGTFGPAIPTGTAAIDVGGGTGGGTAIEIAATAASLVGPTATTVRLYAVAGSAAGSDILLTTTGAANGAPVLFVVNAPPQPGAVAAPSIGLPAALLLGVGLLLLGSRAARRRLLKRALLGLAFVSGIAGAAIFNWNGVAPLATDTSGDSTSGEPAIDLRALFAALNGGNLYFRVDVSGNLAVPTTPPIANAVGTAVAYDSTNNPIALNIGGGAAASVAVSTAPAHGSATASGTSIIYTPTAGYAGADSFQYTAANAGGTSAPATVAITVSAPTVTLNPASLPGGTVGTVYSQALSASGGAAPYSFTVTSGTLPAGLTLNATTGALAGTPAAAATSNFTVTASDSSTGAAAPFTASRSYAVTIVTAANPPVANNVAATVTYDSASNPITLNITGGAAASVTVSTVPAHGSAIASSASITYTPVTGYAGPDSFQYTATNVDGTSAPATVSVTVTAPTIAVNPATLPAGSVGTAYSQALSASGGAAAYTFAVTAGAPPPGLNLNPATGLLAGTPTAGGTSNFTVTTTDSSTGTGPFTGSRAYALTIADNRPFAIADSYTGVVGTPLAVAAPGVIANDLPGSPAATVQSYGGGSLGGGVIDHLPATGTSLAGGTLTINADGGLSLTAPSTPGTYTVMYRLANANGTSDATVTIQIDQAPTILSPASVTFSAGVTATPFSITTSATPTVTSITLTGCTLPAGLTFAYSSGASATISGTPTVGGNVTCLVTASNGIAPDATQNLAITVSQGPAAVADSAATTANTSLSVAAASGLLANDTRGNPPATLTFFGGNSLGGVVTGHAAGASVALAGGTLTVNADGSFDLTTPTQSGQYTFLYRIDNGVGQADALVTIDVNQAAAISSANATSFLVGQAGSFGVTTSGFPKPTLSHTGSLPGAVTFVDNGDGTATLAGTPAAGSAGSYPITITAHNGIGSDATQNFTLTVNEAPTITSTSAATFTAGTPGTFTVIATGTPAPTLSEAGALPGGVTFNAATGVLSGTPAAGSGGSYAVTFTASNGVGSNATQNFTLTVNEAPAITSANGATFPIGQGSSFSVTTSGYPSGAAMAITESGALPNGVTLTNNNNGTATLAGTPQANTVGTYNISIGAANGILPAASQSFTLTVTCPTITLGPASGATFTAGYNAAFTATFAPSGSTGPYTYTVGGSLPNLAFSGNDLTGTPNNTGSFAFTVMATDVWGCHSPVQSYTLNVDPVAADDNYGSIVGNVVVDALSAGITVANNDSFPAGTGSISPTTLTSAHGGSVTITGSGADLGKFVYDPPVGYSGADSFQYTLASNGRSATGTVSFTIAANPIWFVDNTAGACTAPPCDGRKTHPFTSTSTIVNDGAAAHPKDGDSFFVYGGSGSYSGSLTLRANQDLIGQGATATLASLTGQTPGTGQSLPPTSGATPALTSAANTVTLSTNNLVRGVHLATTGAGSALLGTSFNGLLLSEVAATASGASCAAAVNLKQGSGTANITAAFVSVAASGCSNGIALANTTGSFAVAGSSSGLCGGQAPPSASAPAPADCTGGVIQNLAGADGTTNGIGVYLNNVANVSLTRMEIHDAQNYAIRGFAVNGFVFDHGYVHGANGNNAAQNEGSVAFGANTGEPVPTGLGPVNGLVGTAAITHSTIQGGFEDNLRIANQTGSLNRLTVDDVTIGPNDVTNGNNGILIEGESAATINVTIQNSAMSGARGTLVYFGMNGNNTGDLVFQNNALTNPAPYNASTGSNGLSVFSGRPAGSGATTTFNVNNNTFRDANGHAVLIVKTTDTGSLIGTFDSNTIGVQLANGSGSQAGDGLKVQNAGLGTVRATVTNNHIYQFYDYGIELLTGGGAVAMGGVLSTNVTGNTISNVNPQAIIDGFPTNGIHLNAGTVPGDSYSVCANIGGAGPLANVLSGTSVSPSTDFRLRQRQATTVTLPGYAGANNDNAAVVAFVSGRNTVLSGSAVNTVPTGGGGFVGGASCP